MTIFTLTKTNTCTGTYNWYITVKSFQFSKPCDSDSVHLYRWYGAYKFDVNMQSLHHICCVCIIFLTFALSVTEYDIIDSLLQRPTPTESMVAAHIKQLLLVIKELHKAAVLHLDIKVFVISVHLFIIN